MNPSQYLAIAIAAVYGLYKLWPWLSAKLSSLRANLPSLPIGTTTKSSADTITVEQAVAAELLLKRFQAQDNSKDPGAALAVAGIKHLAEATP